ncbi:MAG: gliding motility-associated C-terminal domain-containing protein [Prevotellaceae bacterium]|jgi:gliding motility-associated-like protein|nr:gliding motility-associated C-terminal domain-containing protein [Prevotellaceae bacterium]
MVVSFWRLWCSIAAFILIGLASIQAQDRTFWFVVPDLAYQSNSGSETVDRPVFFVISTGAEAATVVMSMPANSINFSARTFNIAANSSERVVFNSASEMASIENSVLDATCGVKNNKGVLFTSSAEVTIYYQVDSPNSKDIFTLKGSKALGLDFYTPFQTRWNSSPNHNDAYPQFHIVATENNTTVNILPKANIVGTNAGVLKTVILNRGETFAARARNASLRLDGSRVTSDKPVGVVVADDEMQADGALDLGGDQIVPVSCLATNHVLIRGFTFDAYGDYIYILGTRPNTQIFFDSDPTVQRTIQAGETFEMKMDNNTLTRYIRSSEPVYLYQVSGVEDELGAALVPGMYSINSRRISLYTGASGPEISDYLFLLVRSGNEGNFLLNGESGKINASSFSAISGLPEWKYARIDVSNAIRPSSVNVVENIHGAFALGYFRNANNKSALYGYLSMFGQLELPDTTQACRGQELTLDAGYAKSYKWWKSGEPSRVLSTEAIYKVPANETGWYCVRVEQDPFQVIDSTYVKIEEFNALANIPVLFKVGTPQDFSVSLAQETDKSYSWTFSGATTETSSTPNPSGIVWPEAGEANLSLTIRNNRLHCDTVITRKLIVYGTKDTTVCLGTELSLSPLENGVHAEVRWYSDSPYSTLIHTGESITFRAASADTVLYFIIRSEGEEVKDSVKISAINPPTVKAMSDTLICYGDAIFLHEEYDASSIAWNVERREIRPKFTEDYIVTASRRPCPDVRDTVTITVNDSLYISPDALPAHQKGAPYLQQLTSNAANPFFVSHDLPEGFTMSNDGEINKIALNAKMQDTKFTVTITDDYGCELVKEYELVGQLFVPEIFTPDNDGVNDRFMKGFSLIIYDRLGIKIFEGDDGWDGTCKGQAVQQDTYFYILNYTDDDGAKAKLQGPITIVRM